MLPRGPVSPLSLSLVSTSYASHRNMTNVAPLHGGINILLGGAMMGGMLAVVCCICYCCHQRVQKTQHRPLEPPGSGSDDDRWIDSPEDSADSALQVYTVQGQCYHPDCYDGEGVFLDDLPRAPSPPPAYSDVIADPDLPSYEAATAPRLTFYMDQLTYI